VRHRKWQTTLLVSFPGLAKKCVRVNKARSLLYSSYSECEKKRGEGSFVLCHFPLTFPELSLGSTLYETWGLSFLSPPLPSPWRCPSSALGVVVADLSAHICCVCVPGEGLALTAHFLHLRVTSKRPKLVVGPLSGASSTAEPAGEWTTRSIYFLHPSQ